jgi:hypothetical protein
MAIFSHIDHISHKYPMKAKISHIDHILHNHFATFRCALDFLKFLTFMVVVAQVRSFVSRWYSWIDYQCGESKSLIKLIKFFLIDDILDSVDSSFFRNHLKSFICCVWNIEHLSDVFC